MVTRRHFIGKAIGASLGFSSVWGMFSTKGAEAKTRALHASRHHTGQHKNQNKTGKDKTGSSALVRGKTLDRKASSISHGPGNPDNIVLKTHIRPASPHSAHASPLSRQTSPHLASSHDLHPRKTLSHPAFIGQAARPLPVIMLDPGHGGKDPGAIGITGIYEKHVAEATARELCRLLRASKQYKVVLTRTGDYFVPLNGRVELAHRHKADLFMSIHADALHDTVTRGASVYTRAHGASDRQTAFLAEKENSADRFSKTRSQHYLPTVAAILGRMEREETQQHSTLLASHVVSSFEGKIRLLHNPSRHAAFAVLKSADIPSVLVEMGFMSNRLDEAALRQPTHRQCVARALKSAIDQYFVHHYLAMG